jgi:hypothetical protein
MVGSFIGNENEGAAISVMGSNQGALPTRCGLLTQTQPLLTRGKYVTDLISAPIQRPGIRCLASPA